MTEEIINMRVQFDVRGIDKSVRETQRLLYFMNALRLSIVDLQQVWRGPTISNVMWTAVQLTRVWTHLYRLIKATNQAQRIGIAQTMGGTAIRGGVTGAAARRFAGGQVFLPWAGPIAQTGIFSSVTGFAAANPAVTAGIAIALLTAGAVGYDVRQRRIRQEWVIRQQEVAKSQGLIY